MGMQHVEDMLLKFGFAGSDALKGIRTINKELERTVKLLEKVKKARMPVTGPAQNTQAQNRSKQAEEERINREKARKLQRERNRNARFDSSASMLNIAAANPQRAAKLMGDFRRANAAGNVGLMNEIRNQARVINSQMRSAEASSMRIARNFDSAAKVVVGAGGIVMAVQGMKEFLGKIQDASIEMTKVKAMALIGAGDEAGAKKDMEYAAAVAQRLGVNILAASKGYAQVKVASRDVLSESETKNLFESMMEVSRAFGLSEADTKSSLKAITQMLNKGQIQAEELKGQLAERVLGAVQMGAKAMGMTVPELLAEMKKGNVTAKEFLVPLTDELKKTARVGGAIDLATKSLDAERERYENAKTIALAKIGDQGVVDKQSKIYRDLADMISNSKEISEALASMSRGSLVIFQAVVDATESVLKKASQGYNSTREAFKDMGMTEDQADVSTLAAAVAALVATGVAVRKLIRSPGKIKELFQGGGSAMSKMDAEKWKLAGTEMLKMSPLGYASAEAASHAYSKYEGGLFESAAKGDQQANMLVKMLHEAFPFLKASDFVLNEEKSIKIYVDGFEAKIQRGQDADNFHATIPGG